MLTTWLTAQQFEVVAASNGFVAIQKLAKMQQKPDLILLDTQMPVLDGTQFRIIQKGNPDLANIPVIVISGDSDPELFEKLLRPCLILIKPLELNSVLNSIKKTIEK